VGYINGTFDIHHHIGSNVKRNRPNWYNRVIILLWYPYDLVIGYNTHMIPLWPCHRVVQGYYYPYWYTTSLAHNSRGFQVEMSKGPLCNSNRQLHHRFQKLTFHISLWLFLAIQWQSGVRRLESNFLFVA